MKKFILILTIIAILADLVICVVMLNQVEKETDTYFTNLIKQQRSVAQKQVDSIFTHKHTDVFPIYSSCESHFIKGYAKSSQGHMFEDFLDPAYTKPKLPSDVTMTYHAVLEDGYMGDIEGVKYELRSFNRDNEGEQTGIKRTSKNGLWQTGWGLGVRENWSGGIEGRRIVEYIITPYAISFRGNHHAERYFSIDEILDNAYKFYTENDQSDFKRSMVPNVESFINEPYIDNLYYSLEEDKKGHPFLSNISMYADYGTYMYNDLYYVFVKAYGEKIYELVLNKDYVTKKKEQFIKDSRNNILICGTISIGIFVIIGFICALGVYKNVKEENQTILQRILSKCNPKKFVKNSNRHLLDIANKIYSKALVTDINDNEEILKLASLAESELGIVLITKSDIRSLKRKCNPKLFMKPYNPEKVTIANELYTKLNKEKLSCIEYQEIKGRVNTLYEGNEEEKKVPCWIRFPYLKVKRGDQLIILILIIASIIYYVRQCGRNENNTKIEQIDRENSSFKTSSDNEPNSLVNESLKYLDNRLLTGSTPYDVYYGKNYDCPKDQCSGIKVTAPKESDLVVIIKRNNPEGKVISHSYIRAGETCQLDLPNGTFQTFFYYGRGWNPDKEMPNGIRGGFTKDEVFSKDEPQEIGNAILSYILQLQKDGNFNTQSSNSSEMF